MNPPRVQPEDYIDFLIATPKAAQRGRGRRRATRRPGAAGPRRLHPAAAPASSPTPRPSGPRPSPRSSSPAASWSSTTPTLDKPYARRSTWSPGTGPASTTPSSAGINLVALLWTDGDRHIPCDYRIYDKADGRTKNDHFGDMLRRAHARGFAPGCVLFDGWYASLENLKLVRGLGWRWLTRLKAQPPGEPRPAGASCRCRRTAIAAAGHGGLAAGVRAGPGIRDRRPRRRHRVLGDQRPGDGRT